MVKVINQLNVETAPRLEPRFLPDPQPRDVWCPVISVDDHVMEPFSLFRDHGSRAMADALPHVEFDDDEVPYWIVDGHAVPIILANASAGRDPSDKINTVRPQKLTDFRRGVWDVHERVHEMELNGVYASLCFPSMVWGFCGTAFLRMRDQAAGLEGVRSYNRWMLDEWCGSYPDRFIPSQLAWLSDPDVAAAEIRSNAARGFKAVTFSENPQLLGLPSIYSSHWDAFLRACEETGTVINLHVGSSGTVQCPSEESPPEVVTALFPLNSILAGIDWVYADVPARFPELRVVLSEGGASWVPMALERLQRCPRRLDRGPELSLAPVDGFRRMFWFTSLEDPAAFRLLDLIGDDRVMIESDYPHGDSTWPDTQEVLRSETEGVIDPETIRKVAYETAANLYGHPTPPADLLSASAVGAP